MVVAWPTEQCIMFLLLIIFLYNLWDVQYQIIHEISHAIIIDIRLIYFLGAVVSFRYVELSDHSVIQCVNSLRLTECEMECLVSAIEWALARNVVRGCDAM